MNRQVLITGATSGIGLAVTRRLHAAGWRVFAAGLPQDDFTPLRALGETVTPLPLDITDSLAVRQAADAIQQTAADGLHALVNNAGINLPGPLEALPEERVREMFEVNVFGTLQVTRTLLPLLRRAGAARIVFMSSLMGQVALPALGAYSMTKHALTALADTLRLELASQGIHVTVVEPGAVATPMTAAMSQQLAQAMDQADPEVRELYAALARDMQQALERQAQQAVPPERVAATVARVLEARRPPAHVAVSGAARGLMLMRRYAPDEIGDAILRRALGIDRHKR